MKFSTKSFFFSAMIAVLSFASCKKDKTTTDLLTDGSCWKQTKSEYYNSTTSAWENELIDACSADDCTDFTSDNKLAFDEGATKCDPADPQTSTGTWALAADDKTLTITQGGLGFSGTIIEISDSKLVWEYDFLGDKGRITWTK